MGDLLTGLRQAAQRLARERLFTSSVVLIMAIGIGANTAVFSVLNALLLRSLPVTEPQELRVVAWKARGVSLPSYSGGGDLQSVPGAVVRGSFSYPGFRELREGGAAFARLFAFVAVRRLTAEVRGQAATLNGAMVSGDFFDAYPARTLIGRGLTLEDERPNAAPVAVISHSLWQEQFSLDPRVLGETLTLNRSAFTVVGVLPREHEGPLSKFPPQVYVTFAAQPQLAPGTPTSSPRHWWVQIMARLRPGADDASLRAVLDPTLQEALRSSAARAEEAGIVIQDGSRGPMGLRVRLAKPFLALMMLTALVLLVACANLAGLLLARGAAREGDLAVRAAIGASRTRLVRDSLLESGLLAAGGAFAGVLLASWGRRLILASLPFAPGDLRLDTPVDLTVLAFAGGLALLTAFVMGGLPAWRAARVEPQKCLRHRLASSERSPLLGRALVAAQFAAAILLATSAGLLLRSFVNLLHVDPGFRAENVLLFKLDPGQGGYDVDRRIALYDRLRDQLLGIPGVHSVAISEAALGGGTVTQREVSVVGPDGHALRADASLLTVSESFFATMGVPLRSGRDFTPSDARSGERVAVVNEAFVRRFLATQAPLERQFRVGEHEHRIVGVCADAKYQDVRERVAPTAYLSLRQLAPGAMYYEVRSQLPPLSLVPAVRQQLAALDPSLPLDAVTTQAAVISDSLAFERLAADLSAVMALLALLLSGVGLFGLLALAVARRRREIGIRLALGARPGDISRAHLREALRLCAFGLGLGLPASLVTARLMRAVLFELPPHDPVAFLGGALLLLLVGLCAAWLPARRAAQVDPLVALRCE